jgi:adenylate cyclase
MAIPPKRSSYRFAVVIPLALILFGGLSPSPIRGDLQNLLFDSYQRLKPRVWNSETPVRIVDIDDASLARLGQWPWPRTLIADIVKRLANADAAAIAIDAVLAEPDATSPDAIIRRLPATPSRALIEAEIAATKSNDAALADAIAAAPVVLGAVRTQGRMTTTYPLKTGIAAAGDDVKSFLPRFSDAVVPLPDLGKAASGVGATNWLPDRDQTVRRVPLLLLLGNEVVPSLAAESLRIAQAASTIVVRSSNASGQNAYGARSGVAAVKIGDIEIPADRQAEIRVAYSPSEPRRFIPAWKLLAGEVGDDLREHIVLVGSSAAALGDRRATPIDPSVPGVEIHAQVIEQMIEQRVLERPDWLPGAEFVLAIALAIVIGFTLPRIPTALGALGVIVVVAALATASWQAFARYGVLVDPIFSAVAAILTYLSCVVWLFWHEQMQRRYVREAFGRYVSPAVVARLAEDPSKLALGGEKRELTVMFCDIRGFTAIAERLDPQRLTRFMNDYLTAMSEVVLDHGGTIDKYVGDAIMAFWNAPLDDRDHAVHAARASLAMTSKLVELNVRWRSAEGFPELQNDVRFGIGLATGECLVGNLGSERRFDYSALGDCVNVASRMQEATKVYAAAILAPQATRDLAPDLAWIEIDRASLRGRNETTHIFFLAGDESFRHSDEFAELARRYADARAARPQGQSAVL